MANAQPITEAQARARSVLLTAACMAIRHDAYRYRNDYPACPVAAIGAAARMLGVLDHDAMLALRQHVGMPLYKWAAVPGRTTADVVEALSQAAEALA